MFNLVHLDRRTRSLMLIELRRDLAGDRLYLSPRLTPSGRSVYANLLRDAFETGSPESLAASLDSPRYFNSTESRDSEFGLQTVRTPATAAETLGEGEFNRFYMRALCLRAIQDGIDRLIVYRAKFVDEPRNDSQRMIGRSVDAPALLADLRTNIDTLFGIPNGPNSGLSVRLPA